MVTNQLSNHAAQRGRKPPNNHKAAQIKAETALKQSNDQYQSLIKVSPEAIIIHTNSVVQYINSACMKLLCAKSAKEILGRSVFDFIHQDYQSIAKMRFEQIYAQRKPLKIIEERLVRLDGGIVDVEVISIPIVFKNELSVQTVTRDITEKKQIEERQKFLEKISDTLFTSFESLISLKKISKLIVPELADYCRIVLLNGNNSIKEITTNHIDPSKIKLVSELYDSYKNRYTTHGVPKILSSGKSEIISKIDQKIFNRIKNNPELVKVLKSLGLKSYMGVPLIARGKVNGAITFSSIKPNRLYTKTDLTFAEEVARRIALALDNARLYKEAQDEIKERKVIQEKLIRQQESLELSQQAARIGTFEWNMEKNKANWSPEHETLFGVPQSKVNKEPEIWNKVAHPEDIKRIEKEIKFAVKNHEDFYSEFRVVHPDKKVHWVASRGKFFYNSKGKAVRMLGISMDIDTRKQAENNAHFLAEASKILSSSLDYQTTLNSVAHLAVPEISDWCSIDLLDADGKVKQVVVAHKDPAKIKWARELRKIQPIDMSAPTGIPNVLRTAKPEFYPLITNEVLAATSRSPKQLKVAKSLGLTSAMIVPLFADGKTIGAITFVTTETRREYKKSDLAMAEELASRASLAIENARLYKGSQDAITMRDDFISVASHELKTPVTSVKIFTQVLQHHSEAIGDKKAVDYLQKMDKQLNKLTDLIYNLLNISKIQAGRMEFSKKLFDFDKSISEVIEVLQQGSSSHRLVIEGETNKKVVGDEDRIGQVLSNLVSNALKYSPKEKKVIIKLSADSKNVTVAVQDFGIGMADKHLVKIFERFYRVYDTTDKTFPGLGIGLYISAEIVKRHKGKLWVESNAGKGSTFYFSIPIKSTR